MAALMTDQSKKGGRFVKECGTEFMHSKWNIQADLKPLTRNRINQENIIVLDKLYKQEKHKAVVSYCQKCIDYVSTNCSDCGMLRNPLITPTVDVSSQTQDEGATPL